jgi:hypothetical protein
MIISGIVLYACSNGTQNSGRASTSKSFVGRTFTVPLSKCRSTRASPIRWWSRTTYREASLRARRLTPLTRSKPGDAAPHLPREWSFVGMDAVFAAVGQFPRQRSSVADEQLTNPIT